MTDAVTVILDADLLRHVISFMRGPSKALLSFAVTVPPMRVVFHERELKNHVVVVCEHTIASDNLSILRMLEEYCGQPTQKTKDKEWTTIGEEAAWMAVQYGDMVATQWLMRFVARQDTLGTDLLDLALSKIVQEASTDYVDGVLCEWSEGHEQIAHWLSNNRPECCVRFTAAGLNGAATQELVFSKVFTNARASHSHTRRCAMLWRREGWTTWNLSSRFVWKNMMSGYWKPQWRMVIWIWSDT